MDLTETERRARERERKKPIEQFLIDLSESEASAQLVNTLEPFSVRDCSASVNKNRIYSLICSRKIKSYWAAPRLTVDANICRTDRCGHSAVVVLALLTKQTRVRILALGLMIFRQLKY